MRLTCVVLVAGALTVFIAPEWSLPPVAHFLDVSDAPRKVDCVLVLNGDPETRPFAAAALVKVGLAREVLLTRQRLALESAAVREGAMLSELEIIERVLRARGVAASAIHILPGQVTSTADEARILAAFLDVRPRATVAVVTNGFHTRRARMVFRRMVGANAERVFFFGVPRDKVSEDSWWRSPHGCMVYLGEYCKLPYYWARY